MNLWPAFSSFLIIAAAELGDKTQLLTLALTARYPFWEVMVAVGSATAALMALAVVLGGAIHRFVPDFFLQLFTGCAFIFFGLWTFFGKEKAEETKKNKGKPFWIIFSAFFMAELGDKTQLAAFALSAEYGAPFLVWLGATVGMVAANLAAALAGGFIKKFIPENHIKWLGAATFIFFGLITLGGLLLSAIIPAR
ncbi:TMEM165/GDT1 family protein [Candidatus Saganbacteria bacterium]|nr:TMEM165/GDT1 family protein [Candidatus Saganbacteria bacterium]